MSHSDRMQYPSQNLVWAGRAIISVLLMDPMKAAPYIWSRRLRRKVAGRKTDNQWESVRFVVAHYWVNARKERTYNHVEQCGDWWPVHWTFILQPAANMACSTSTSRVKKNKKLNSCLQLHQILTDFQIFFATRLSGNFPTINVMFKYLSKPSICRYTTLWNMNVRKLAILLNMYCD